MDLFLKICKLILFFVRSNVHNLFTFQNYFNIYFPLFKPIIKTLFKFWKKNETIIDINFIPVVSNQDVFFKYSSLNNLNCHYSKIANDLL